MLIEGVLEELISRQHGVPLLQVVGPPGPDGYKCQKRHPNLPAPTDTTPQGVARLMQQRKHWDLPGQTTFVPGAYRHMHERAPYPSFNDAFVP